MIGVALLVGFRPTAGVWGWIGAVAMIAVYILTITYLFAAIGLAAGSPEAASGYGFIILFLPYLSSAFVPVDTMPTWLQWIAENQPVTPIIETIRGLLFGSSPRDGAVVGPRLVRRHPRRGRRVGRVALPPQGRRR